MTIACYRCIVLVSAFLFSLSSLAQGPLVPSGAPAATMKTLQQIEPRTPIDALPKVIGASGSYYVTGNIGPSGPGAGILVTASDVTIDLSGFVLTGDPADGAHGIFVAPGLENVTIRNGVLREWGGDGIHAPEVKNLHVENVIVHDCEGDGLEFSSGTIGGSHFHNNLGAGIQNSKPIPGIGIVVKKNPGSSSARENGSGGVVLEGDCDVEFSGMISGNASDGIRWTATASGQKPRLMLEDAVIENNLGNGVIMVTVDPVAMDFSATRCRIGNNGVAGVDLHAPSLDGEILASLTDCDLVGNAGPGAMMLKGGGKASPMLFKRCQVSDNDAEGLRITGGQAHLDETYVQNNTSHGISLGAKKEFKGHVTLLKRGGSADRNGGDGIHIYHVEDDVDPAIVLDRVSCSGNTGAGVRYLATLVDSEGSVRIDDSQINGNVEEGIRAVGGSLAITGSSVSKNNKDGLKLDGKKHTKSGHVTLLKRTAMVNNGGNGVYIATSEDDAECRVVIEDSQLNGNTENGLKLVSTHAGSLASLSWLNSHASANGVQGAVVEGGVGTRKGSVTFRGGDCDDNGASGIVISHLEVNSGLITGMSISHNGGMGIISYGHSISISGNVISRNTGVGISVWGNHHYIADNRIQHNSGGIELLGNNNALANNVHNGPGAPIADFTGTNPSAPIQDVTVGVNPLGNIIY